MITFSTCSKCQSFMAKLLGFKTFLSYSTYQKRIFKLIYVRPRPVFTPLATNLYIHLIYPYHIIKVYNIFLRTPDVMQLDYELLDDVNLKILDKLGEDSSTPFVEIAKQIGVSDAT